MNNIQKLNTPFFLTGGTALSRHYFSHRYSDDLVLFVNSYGEFRALLDTVLISLGSTDHQKTFLIEKGTIKRYENYSQIFVLSTLKPEKRFKIDFVNDLALNYGSFENNQHLRLIDGWRNILSNKLTALFRYEPKDIADIWSIACHRKFNWRSIISEAKSKEAGVEPEVIFNILKSFPTTHLQLIKWIGKPGF